MRTSMRLSDSAISAAPLVESARRIIGDHAIGALSRPDPSGDEDILWIGPAALTPDGHHVVMLSSRYSRLAIDLLAWSEVEWVFTDRTEEARVQLRGRAMIADTPAQLARWSSFLSRQAKKCLLESPSRAYGFIAVVTEVHSLRVVVQGHGIDLTCHVPPPHLSCESPSVGKTAAVARQVSSP